MLGFDCWFWSSWLLTTPDYIMRGLYTPGIWSKDSVIFFGRSCILVELVEVCANVLCQLKFWLPKNFL